MKRQIYLILYSIYEYYRTSKRNKIPYFRAIGTVCSLLFLNIFFFAHLFNLNWSLPFSDSDQPAIQIFKFEIYLGLPVVGVMYLLFPRAGMFSYKYEPKTTVRVRVIYAIYAILSIVILILLGVIKRGLK